MIDKTRLIDEVIVQIEKDIHYGDRSAFYELLDGIHEDDLFNYLPIETQERITKEE